jgi:hypothetical protein
MVVLCEQHQVGGASGSRGGSNYSDIKLIIVTQSTDNSHGGGDVTCCINDKKQKERIYVCVRACAHTWICISLQKQ